MRRALQVLFAALIVLAGSALPIQTAWAEPEVRLQEVAAWAGLPVSLDHAASHLGVRWTGDDDAVVELRSRPTGAAWTAWEAMAVAHDMGDEERRDVRTGLVLAPNAVTVEVRVAAGAVTDLRVIAIDTQHGPRRLVLAGAAPKAAAALNAGATVPQPPVVSRSEWGANESLVRGTPTYASVRRLSVHHTVSSNNDPDPEATMRAILAYHTQSNGWDDVGYNFLIDASGRIYEGRSARQGTVPGEDRSGNLVVGAHTANSNSGTVGVALLGTFTDQAPSAAAMASLERVMTWEADRHGVDTLATTTWTKGSQTIRESTLIGHRDTSATACPGGALYDQLPALRQRIAVRRSTGQSTDPTPGYWVLGKDSGVYAFGAAERLAVSPGSAPASPPANSMASTPSGRGYWVLSGNGRVTAFGDATVHGSTEGMRLNAPAVRLEPTRSGAGYWILAADGGVFSFGDAAFHGSTGDLRLNAPVISMSATASGAGYWLLAADGGVFTFGDGAFHGSTGSLRLNAPVISMAPHPAGSGYWLQAADGGIFSFGAVQFWGSVPELRLEAPPRSVQIRVTRSGQGYYVLGVDGSVRRFGDAIGHGSPPPLADGAAAIDLVLRP